MLSALLLSTLIAVLVPKGTASYPPAETLQQVHTSISGGPAVTPSLAAADTVLAGEAYIKNLPDSLDTRAVSRYRGIALPARSWLVNRTFFWKTTDADRGLHSLWFRAVLSDGTADSLAVEVVVR